MGNAEPDGVAGCIHINRHQTVGRIDEEKLLAVSAPSGSRSAIGGDLPLRASPRDSSDVDFRPAGLIIPVRHPFPVRRDQRLPFFKWGLHDRKWLAIARQRTHPKIK